MPKLRVGIPPGVACRPLVWGLLKGHFGELLSARESPAAALPQMLAEGRLDLALVGSLDALRLEGVEILADLCLSVTGDAGLALLLHREPLVGLRTVASAPGSQKIESLLALVLRLRGLPMPTLQPHQPVLSKMLEVHDAALLTGPMAAEVEVPLGCSVLDLTAAWESETGFPWVDAVWVVRESVTHPELAFYFKSSLRYGLSMLRNLVRESAAAYGLDSEALSAHFEAHYTYVLRKRERASLEELVQQVVKAGLAESPSLPPMRA